MKINGWEKLNCMDVYVSGHPADIIGMITIDFFEWKTWGRYQGEIRSTIYDGLKDFRFKLTPSLGNSSVIDLLTFVDHEPYQQFVLHSEHLTLKLVHDLLNTSFNTDLGAHSLKNSGKVRA
jgi:uncharacterized protein VirK/YbjX